MYPNLRAEMARSGISVEEMAKGIEISVRTLHDKLSGRTDFTFSQAIKIRARFFPGCELEYLFTKAA